MAVHTTTTVTNELDFVGHIWQPDTGLCVGRARPDSAAVLEIEARAAAITAGRGTPPPNTEATTWKAAGIDAMRQACYEWLSNNQGDFLEIVDFYADFGAPGVDGFYFSEWSDPRHEMTFEDADGYGREPGEVGVADCDWCGVPSSVITNAFGEPLCADCAAECCATCSRGLANEGEHDGCSGEPLRVKEGKA